jgi:DNA-binding transcriptional LysR family regulator
VDISAIDLRLLVTLDALLAERNVSRAAGRLGVSQPALSAQLARLRELFGDPLFVRTARGMLPTARAESVAHPLRQLLHEIGRLVEPHAGFDPATAAPTFKIAASDYVEYALLPVIVDCLEARAPRARFALRPTDFRGLARQLESGEADLAILARENLEAPVAAIRSRPLYSERFVCAARRRHPELVRGLTLDVFCALDHLFALPWGGAFAGRVDEALAAIGRTRNVRLSVPHFLLAPEILARSDLIAVLPERLTRGYTDRLQVFAMPVTVPDFTIVAAWHERVHRDPAQAWLRRTIVALTAPWSEAAPPASPGARRKKAS